MKVAAALLLLIRVTIFQHYAEGLCLFLSAQKKAVFSASSISGEKTACIRRLFNYSPSSI